MNEMEIDQGNLICSIYFSTHEVIYSYEFGGLSIQPFDRKSREGWGRNAEEGIGK